MGGAPRVLLMVVGGKAIEPPSIVDQLESWNPTLVIDRELVDADKAALERLREKDRGAGWKPSRQPRKGERLIDYVGDMAVERLVFQQEMEAIGLLADEQGHNFRDGIPLYRKKCHTCGARASRVGFLKGEMIFYCDRCR